MVKSVRGYTVLAGVVMTVLAAVAFALQREGSDTGDAADAGASPRPVLSVETVRPQVRPLPIRVPASGSVAAWQEARVGAESNGLRLIDLRVDVGDRVRRGQILARFDADLLRSELAEARAAVAMAQAEALDAEQVYRRAQGLDPSGALSAQQISHYAAAVTAAKARLDGARAAAASQAIRVRDAVVRAPTDGIVSARPATLGAVVASGQELFRLIVDGRLEWRAAVSADDLARLVPGQPATLALRGGAEIRGVVRRVAPEIDAETRRGLVYIDLPSDSGLRPGNFATGHVEVGERQALTVPQRAVLLRDGFHVAMVVDAASRVQEVRVDVGQRIDAQIEIIAGLSAADPLVASGLGFLGDGDRVRVVPGDAPPPVDLAASGDRE
jgi:RND family efflux transporter MFP subunit